MLRDQKSLYRVLIIFAILLAGCSPHPAEGLAATWDWEDLRLLDPDDADHPDQDLIAAYLREVGDELQIRLDLLQADDLAGFDLYIALDARDGGTKSLPITATAMIEMDLLLKIPAQGKIELREYSGKIQAGAAILVLRDPINENLLISLNQDFPLQTFIGI